MRLGLGMGERGGAIYCCTGGSSARVIGLVVALVVMTANCKGLVKGKVQSGSHTIVHMYQEVHSFLPLLQRVRYLLSGFMNKMVT